MKIERNYETGIVKIDGMMYDLVAMPESTKRLCLVYGFIRRIQDPFGSEKDKQKHDELVKAAADDLMKGVMPERTSAKSSIVDDAVVRMRERGMDEETIAIVIQTMYAAIEAKKVKAKKAKAK